MPTKARTLSVRLEPELELKLERMARETGRDKSKVLRLLLRQAQVREVPDIILEREESDND